MSGEFNGNDYDGDTPAANGSGGPGSPSTATAAPTMPTTDNNGTTSSAGLPKAVEDVMYSDIGITTLLNRLKQSIASARDFASFLKSRSKLEEEQATGLKRLAAAQLDSLKRAEVRGGSYASQVAEVMRVQERMADNGMQFALSLHQMHEDLNMLSNNMERGRKQCKHEGLDAEKRASDAEAAMQKAKGRYDGLAEDYDRARTGDTKGSRRIGLKGPKSQEQYESDLQRKLQAADADYEEKVRLAKGQREGLLNEHRPKNVRMLRELCEECDAGLTLQLQKFATFNEKLLLGNGLAISPLTGDNSSQRNLRDIIGDIDNNRDFCGYVGGHASKVPPRTGEIKYEQHPTLLPKTQQPKDRSASSGAPPPSQAPSAVQQPTLSVNTSSQPNSMNNRYTSQQPPGPLVAPSVSQAYSQPEYQQQPSPSQAYEKSPSYIQSPSYNQPQHQPPYNQQQPPMQNTTTALPPYPTHASERSGYPPQQTTGSISGPQQRNQYGQPPSSVVSPMSPSYGAPTSAAAAPPTTILPPLRQTFGLSLQALFDRDQSAVPMVVIQCILAVDHFGLETTGIYRQSGTSSLVQKLVDQFNHNPASVDFRNPANFYHDVHIPATLLKQFFKQLPDPLFTQVGYGRFIEAARIEDEERRRDALHQGINDLPDPNYATMRALVLHLHRVMQQEGKTRMGSGNLAVCFAPSLMGTHTGSQIADAGLQARVLDTILVNATAIFDED